MSDWVGIDLFAGAGGMSLGAEAAGIEVAVAVEACPFAAKTYAINFPATAVHCADVREYDRWVPLIHRGKNTVLFGGPPCQGFSTSNQRTRNTNNERNHLVFSFVEAVARVMPDVVVMENVRGILEAPGSVFLDRARGELAQLGYESNVFVLNAADFGVPQRRTRVFVIGARGKAPNLQLDPSHQTTSVWEALHDLPLLENGAAVDELGYSNEPNSPFAKSMRGNLQRVTGNLVTRNSARIIERYRHIPPGSNWESVPAELMDNYADRTKCHTGIYRRLHPDEPSVVIGNYRKNMLIHPTQHRGLSVREAARLQSIPDTFQFSGSIGFQQQQVGNMVPPSVAAHVFLRIREGAP